VCLERKILKQVSYFSFWDVTSFAYDEDNNNKAIYVNFNQYMQLLKVFRIVNQEREHR